MGKTRKRYMHTLDGKYIHDLKGSMTSEQFHETMNHVNISDQSKDIAYGVLVENKTLSFYSKKYNISSSAIHQICKRIKNQFLEISPPIEIPEDLKIVIALIPETQMPQFEKNQEEIFKRFKLDRNSVIGRIKADKLKNFSR